MPPEKSPADLAIEAEGGEIIPEMFQGGAPAAPPPKVLDAPAPGKAKAEVDLTPPPAPLRAPGSPLKGREMTPEEAAAWTRATGQVDFELNLLRLCYLSAKELVYVIQASSPLDSAQIGKTMWAPGQPTPIEAAEPQIALEVYKQVRRTLRKDESRERRKRSLG